MSPPLTGAGRTIWSGSLVAFGRGETLVVVIYYRSGLLSAVFIESVSHSQMPNTVPNAAPGARDPSCHR